MSKEIRNQINKVKYFNISLKENYNVNDIKFDEDDIQNMKEYIIFHKNEVKNSILDILFNENEIGELYLIKEKVYSDYLEDSEYYGKGNFSNMDESLLEGYIVTKFEKNGITLEEFDKAYIMKLISYYIKP